MIDIAKAYYHELGGVKLTVNKVTPEDVETVRSLIESADKKYEYVKEVQKIIEEEANIYINKAKTKEETAKVIQSRIKLYLEEQKK